MVKFEITEQGLKSEAYEIVNIPFYKWKFMNVN